MSANEFIFSKVTSVESVTLLKHKQLYKCFENILSTF